MLVARGAAEVMVELELRTGTGPRWSLIVRGGGRPVTQLDGAPLAHGGSVLTTNGVVHDEVVRLFARP